MLASSSSAQTQPPAQVQVTQNSTDVKLDEKLMAEIYRQVRRQMELRDLRAAQQPVVKLRMVSTRDAERALEQCAQGGCGHVLRFGVLPEQEARVVFLSLKSGGAELWMDYPDAYLLAKAITVTLDYENRLYLAPDEIHQIADVATIVAHAERHSKVSVSALQAQR